MNDCYCCNYRTNKDKILFENEYAVCVTVDDPVLVDSCVIIPKEHKTSPFELSLDEWVSTKDLLDKVKKYLDEKCCPDGYNLGWNIGRVAGQIVFHAHMHVIPRFSDEPFAGFGIRHWFKMDENKRPSAISVE